MLRARLYYDTCAPLLRHVPFIAAACRQTNRMYVHVRDQNDNATYASTRWVLTIMHFLPCEDVAGGTQQSGGKCIFREIRWPVRWVPAVRWRNHYFARNKEPLPCCGRGPSCQPLHVQYSSDGSRSLTMLTTRAPRAPGRWTTVRPRKGTTRSRGRRGSGSPRGEEYEGHWFGCGVRLPSPQGLASGGNSRGR